jgi:hypothetical protein
MMNEHGDIWQEPSLFDAPADALPESERSKAFRADHRRHVAENETLPNNQQHLLIGEMET